MRLAAALVWLSGWWLLHRDDVASAEQLSSASVAAHDATCRLQDWAAPGLLPLEPACVTQSSISSPPPPLPQVSLLIGVKSSVVHGAAARRAIRETWASSAALPANVRVVFLGCAPDLSAFNASEATRVRNAIATERVSHGGDLLVEELASCRDAYDDLVNKVLAFFQWSVTVSHPQDHKTYVMVTDDDIYLRVAALLTMLEKPEIPARRFYGGQVWSVQYRRAIAPVRHPRSARYFLSRDHYPLDQLPPFANGPHYLLSADIAKFLGQSRAFFRGVGGDPEAPDFGDSIGAFDDVSVALWMLAMQIHPRHLEGMENIRDAMCLNSFVSYADISPDAIYAIHGNLEAAKRAPCLGFSYATWIKAEEPTRVPQYLQERAQHLDAWNAIARTYTIERASHEYDVTVVIGMRLKDAPTDDTRELTARFVPAITSYFPFCELVATHVPRKLGLLADQSVFVCEQLRRSLVEEIELRLARLRHASRPMFTLLLFNLANETPVPLLKVSVTRSARYALVVVENLLTQAYEGMELQVYDEETYSAEQRDPDILVFTTRDAENDEAASARIAAFAAKYTASRLVLLHPRETSRHAPPLHERVLVVSSSLRPAALARPPRRELYLPLAAVAFGSTGAFSPMDLLRPFNAAATFRVRHFCVDDYAPRQCEHPHRAYFFNLLNALDRVDVAGACTRRHDTRQSPLAVVVRNNSLAESITTENKFYLSLKVARYEQFKFTIAFEDAVNVPGHVGDTIVAAFLAGSIPIYYGHSPTVSRLFNPKAFIDCSTFLSLRACAKRVLVVHSSPFLSEAMRREAPVVNTTAFYEAFSWHPDVAAMVKQTRSSIHTSGHCVQTMGEQFKEMIDGAP